MKILYAGTPEFAVAPLENIIASQAETGIEVVGVITQTDKPQGRKGILTPPPVKVKATELGLPVFQPAKIGEFISELQALGAEALVTCAYGQILTQAVLNAFPKGVWNIHAGLLPKYRGASPIQSCILAGEVETGVSVMKTELGLDSGDVLAVRKTPIGEYETCGELSARLSALGAEMIVEALKGVKSGDYRLTKQETEGVQTVRKIGKEQARIDFTKSAREIVNLVRAMNPAPIAYACIGGNKLNVLKAEVCTFENEGAEQGEVLCDQPKKGFIVKCGEGAIKIIELQPAGGKKMNASDFLNGRKVKAGEVFDAL
ncbi:MAG: methionyl-tRNA formyltransferase [Clostridia bacterium]|nr:methionyl-tRNA formyltransferase [Clostridia bacterium]